jgi:hypothetical protein
MANHVYQVHLIASHYHWSEAEILRLPNLRRKEYVDLIIKDLEAESGKKSWG